MPQPIDMQTELARTTAVERIQQVADRISLTAQQQHARQLAEEQLAAEQQVRQSHESENPEVDAEARGQNAAERRKQRQKKEEQAQHSDPRLDAAKRPIIQDGENEHRLDVSV